MKSDEDYDLTPFPAPRPAAKPPLVGISNHDRGWKYQQEARLYPSHNLPAPPPSLAFIATIVDENANGKPAWFMLICSGVQPLQPSFGECGRQEPHEAEIA